jgi:hypothetical protein
MDPTLAPGYVPPNNTRVKTSTKGHHWAEVQKERARTTTNNSETEATVNGDNSDASTTPPAQHQFAVRDRKRKNDVAKTAPPNPHLRMASWRAGRSALSDGEGIGGPADLEEVPIGLKRQALRLEDYVFPETRLRTVMDGMIPPKLVMIQSPLPRYCFQKLS